MKWTAPGFPTEVSEQFELPDIGELLLMPSFQGILAEDFMKHATDFQKWLFNKVPLRNDKKAVTIRSSVHLLYPGYRSHVGSAPGAGWHIDGITKFDYREPPSERVFILSSPCKSLTEFNLNPIEFECEDNETNDDFFNRINNNLMDYGIVGKAIEPGRIYTFENHLHRAIEPSRIEFRYFLRVRETNGTDVFANSPIMNNTLMKVGSGGVRYKNIEYGNGRIHVYLPGTHEFDRRRETF